MSHRTLALTLAIATGLAVAASFVQAAAPETLVGKWSTATGKCVRPLSIIVIGPRSLSGEDFSCDFDTVKRAGGVVTWRGACRFGADDPVPETVTARVASGRLMYRFSSEQQSNGPFHRCR